MAKALTATATTNIDATPAQVWKAITDRATIRKFMAGAEVSTDWHVGSSIVWNGEWEGRPYQDHGVIQQVVPNRRLVMTHFSPLSGQEDRPENYHTVTWELDSRGVTTRVTLSQDGNRTEEAREHSQRSWQTMLDGLKRVVEG